MLFIYVAGIPLSAFVVLYKQKLWLRSIDSVTSTDKESEETLLSFLYVKFQMKYWWFGFTYIARQIILICLTTFIVNANTQFLVAIVLAAFCMLFVEVEIYFIVLILHTFVRPFKENIVWFNLCEEIIFSSILSSGLVL